MQIIVLSNDSKVTHRCAKSTNFNSLNFSLQEDVKFFFNFKVLNFVVKSVKKILLAECEVIFLIDKFFSSMLKLIENFFYAFGKM